MNFNVTKTLTTLSIATLSLLGAFSLLQAQAQAQMDAKTVYEEIYKRCTVSKASALPPPAPAPAQPAAKVEPKTPVKALW